MWFRFRRPRRQWKLKYTFVYQNNEVQESDRFLTQEEAEQRFQTMHAYHTQLQQRIIHAELIGPNGFRRDLTPVNSAPHAMPQRLHDSA